MLPLLEYFWYIIVGLAFFSPINNHLNDEVYLSVVLITQSYGLKVITVTYLFVILDMR